MTPLGVGVIVLSVTAATLVSCGGSPTVNYYTLAVLEKAQMVEKSRWGDGYTVSVGPVNLPEVVDRPQFVVRVGSNEVVLSEEHRWAESLASAIPRVIAENLAHLLNGDRISVYPYSAVQTADYRVIVDVQHFDSEGQQAAIIDALWSIQSAQKNTPNKTGHSVVREPTEDKSYKALAAAHSRALATLSRDIAEALHSVVSSPGRGQHGKRCCGGFRQGSHG